MSQTAPLVERIRQQVTAKRYFRFLCTVACISNGAVHSWMPTIRV
jgi:hypothetical protein